MYEFSGAPRGGRFYGRKYEEFIADFEAVSRRALDGAEFDLLKLHFFEGLDWKVCCARLGVNKGNFFHTVYAVEERLGRAFRETEPYALFPLDEYFSNIGMRRKAKPVAVLPMPAVRAIRPVLRRPAASKKAA
jgi:predicted DNA-binding protein (UPF0251 family)